MNMTLESVKDLVILSKRKIDPFGKGGMKVQNIYNKIFNAE